MTDEQKKRCHEIIHAASISAAAVGAGAASVPVVGSFVSLCDESAITPIQITMIVSLGKVFDVSLDKTTAASLLTGMVTAKVGRKVAGFFAGLVPGLGSVVNGGTAASITEGVGWAAVAYFDK
ncbi:hypothetical protein [Romboutsia timonensis]|uniref:hypothetical protein n=1 Tax=Romboutsia timonensis TaxID=1776391 RepID=UPI00265CCC99|nr:hypothetical protein [uncultured Clostridium sp.]